MSRRRPRAGRQGCRFAVFRRALSGTWRSGHACWLSASRPDIDREACLPARRRLQSKRKAEPGGRTPIKFTRRRNFSCSVIRLHIDPGGVKSRFTIWTRVMTGLARARAEGKQLWRAPSCRAMRHKRSAPCVTVCFAATIEPSNRPIPRGIFQKQRLQKSRVNPGAAGVGAAARFV
jgi:hypothetical protein